MRHDFNAFAGVTYNAYQHPEKYADNQYGPRLYGRNISDQNVDKRDDPANDPHIEPPENPMVNSNVDMHNAS
jgi:hypothetical protein